MLPACPWASRLLSRSLSTPMCPGRLACSNGLLTSGFQVGLKNGEHQDEIEGVGVGQTEHGFPHLPPLVQ